MCSLARQQGKNFVAMIAVMQVIMKTENYMKGNGWHTSREAIVAAFSTVFFLLDVSQ